MRHAGDDAVQLRGQRWVCLASRHDVSRFLQLADR
jgi:hypothetical protein